MQFMEAARERVLDARAVNDLRNPCPVARGKTHGTRLAGRINHAAGQIDRAQPAAGLANGMDFRMRRDVGGEPDHIVLTAQWLSVAHDAGAERSLSFGDALLCFLNGKAHESRVW